MNGEGSRFILDIFGLNGNLWKCSPTEFILSDSTYEGFCATISCTLDLTKYLSNLGFKYLMIFRLNQDHLEHFFGMMKAADGWTHPESIQVGQIFHLMSVYSLIKPPRGSNVSGGEMMKSLLHIGDLIEKKQKFIFDIEIEENISEIEEDFSDIDEAFAYFCGYVTKKIKSTTKCGEYVDSILGKGNEMFNSLIRNESRGFLTFASQKIISFLHDVEATISGVFERELTRNCLSVISSKLSNFSPKNIASCELHKEELSREALRAYLISRLSICCAEEHIVRALENKSKYFSKMAKLY